MRMREVIRGCANDDSRTDRHARRINLNCSMCPPNRSENAKRRSRHGNKKKRGHRRG